MSRPIKEIMQDLAKARSAQRDAYSYVKSLNGEVSTFREELDASLRELGLKTASTEDGLLTAYFSRRVSANVFDPDATRDWLAKNDMIVNDYFRPDSTRLASLAKGALKETGEIIPGLELVTNEALSLKDNSKAEDKESAG